MAENPMSPERLEHLLDRYGPDFASWPDRGEAQTARRLALADTAARALLEEAKRLEALFDARAEAVENRAAKSGLAGRALAAILPELAPRRSETRLWAMRLAACFLGAAVVGSGVDRIAGPVSDPAPAEVVMLETVLYGPAETEIR